MMNASTEITTGSVPQGVVKRAMAESDEKFPADVIGAGPSDAVVTHTLATHGFRGVGLKPAQSIWRQSP